MFLGAPGGGNVGEMNSQASGRKATRGQMLGWVLDIGLFLALHKIV